MLASSGAVPAGERADDRLHHGVSGAERRAGSVRVLREPRQAARGVPAVVHLGGTHGGRYLCFFGTTAVLAAV